MIEFENKNIDKIKGNEKESFEFDNKNEENTKVSVKDNTIIEKGEKTKNEEKTNYYFTQQ